jgi:hypothetical protein
MVRIIQLVFALVAYVCVASIVTLALGVGYLWNSDRLDDEKVFRIVALLQDVDLEQLTQAPKETEDDVPPEEPSLEDVLHHQRILDRNFEVKLLALQRGRQEYDHRLQQLKEQTDRYDRLAQDWQSRLKKQEELTTQENLAKVVSQLEQVKPDQGKALLMLWIDEGRMDDAILLMSKMSESKLSKILKKFETDEELAKLHEIQQRIISGGAANSQLQQALDDLKTPVDDTADQSTSSTNP